ncbi:hypothetical protein [Saccharopolyspora hattusasensis]|uniref:hypothetical protein n=1 Tax=Saccharopolyspora hattusasensis TaxID=1128679 RepID=UPI003D974B05
MKQEQRVTAVKAAIEQAREAIEKASVPGMKWYLTRDRQERERLGLGGEPEVDLGFVLRDDPQWRLVEAKHDALMHLADAVEEAASLWLR